eukprot:2617092-Pyramimonas_sp.AAC.1
MGRERERENNTSGYSDLIDHTLRHTGPNRDPRDPLRPARPAERAMPMFSRTLNVSTSAWRCAFYG